MYYLFVWEIILSSILTDLQKGKRISNKKNTNGPDLSTPGQHPAGPAHLWHRDARAATV
jgi:hypothetical protein